MKKKCICGICPTGCHVITTIENGEIYKVEPDRESVYGNLCPIGAKAREIIYSSKRVIRPLIRTGIKGEISFKEGTWEEALDIIEQKLKNIKKECGARAVSSYMGRGTLEDSLYVFGDAPLKEFGSPNDLDCGSICNVASTLIAPVTTLGMNSRSTDEDYENADTIIVWGINPYKNNPPVAYRKIKEAKKRGTIIISIDPRKNQTADLADLWIPIRPGTDGALTLGVIDIIIKNDWYDKEFVDKWCVGFEELKEYVNSFNIDRVEKLCGVSKEDILFLAKSVASDKRTAITFYTGLEYANSGIQNMRAIYILQGITGNIDAKGGLYIDTYPLDIVEESVLPEGDLPIGAKEYQLFYALAGRGHFDEFPKAVLNEDPYGIKALILIGGSPITSYPNPDLWKKVYNKLDFLVIVDRFMPEEAKWADIILPAATYYETYSFQYYVDRVCIRERIIEPIGEAKADTFILGEIAERLGYGYKYPKNEEELINKSFENEPRILEELKKNNEAFYDSSKAEAIYKKYETGKLRKDGEKGFPTPTGKFEIKSSILEKYGFEGLPVYKDPYDYMYEKNEEDIEYPLTLTTGARGLVRQNSQYIEIDELIKYEKEPVVEINPVDADARGIKNGDEVLLKTKYGQVSFKALITDRIGKGIVHAPHGGGKFTENEGWRNSNVNSVIDHNLRDEISGYIVLKSLNCSITKA